MADPLEVNQKTLAEVLNLTTRQVRNLDELGLPSRPAPNGKDRLYSLPRAVGWYLDRERERLRPSAKDQADARRAAAQARLAELELEEREGSLLPVVVHQRVMGEVFDDVRSNLLNLPGSVATQLVGLAEPREAVAVLRPAVDNCLTRLVAIADELEDRAEGSAGPLPEDFPAARYLLQAGITSLAALRRQIQEDTLEEIPGIGPARARAIRAEVEAA